MRPPIAGAVLERVWLTVRPPSRSGLGIEGVLGNMGADIHKCNNSC